MKGRGARPTNGQITTKHSTYTENTTIIYNNNIYFLKYQFFKSKCVHKYRQRDTTYLAETNNHRLYKQTHMYITVVTNKLPINISTNNYRSQKYVKKNLDSE